MTMLKMIIAIEISSPGKVSAVATEKVAVAPVIAWVAQTVHPLSYTIEKTKAIADWPRKKPEVLTSVPGMNSLLILIDFRGILEKILLPRSPLGNS